MTYLRFHALFNLPLLIFLVGINFLVPWKEIELFILFGLLVVVMIFTSPWDNYAVKKGIWGFPEKKYWFKIKYLPVEEYLFFILETVNVIFLVRFLLYFKTAWRSGEETVVITAQWAGCGALMLVWILTGIFFLRKKTAPRWNYAFHLLYWFLPVIGLQWILGWTVFTAGWRIWCVATVAFGVYYTITDWIAVSFGTWTFDEKQITGLKLGRILPWEEIAFFFLTALLVAQSYLLLLPADLR